MIEIYEINIANLSVEWLPALVFGLSYNGFELVVNDGKFYMQRLVQP